MKRQEPIRHVESQGCRLLRDKGKHSVYVNPANNQISPYRDIEKSTAFSREKFVATSVSPSLEGRTPKEVFRLALFAERNQAHFRVCLCRNRKEMGRL